MVLWREKKNLAKTVVRCCRSRRTNRSWTKDFSWRPHGSGTACVESRKP